MVETWLNEKTQDSLICPQGYQIIRKDRNNREDKTKGGGIVLIHKENVNIVDITRTNADSPEHIAVDIIFRKRGMINKIRICCCYLAPAATAAEMKNVCTHLKSYYCDYPLYFVGDYNLPNVDWKNNHSTKSSEVEFLNFCNEMDLKQHIFEPTHTAGSTLDLLLTNSTGFNCLNCYKLTPPFASTSDHLKIEFELSIPNSKKSPNTNREYYDFRKANYKKNMRKFR